MKRIEQITLIFLALLLILRLTIGPVTNVYFMIASVLLAIFYLWFGFFLFNDIRLDKSFSRHTYNNLDKFKISSSIIMGLIYSFTILSIMTAICFYSIMNVMLIISTSLLLLSIAVFLFYNQLKIAGQDYFAQFYRRSLAFAVFCLFVLITPIESRLQVLFHDHPEFVNAYKNYMDNPDDPEAKEELNTQRNRFR